MEFVIFLDKIELEIIRIIEQAEYSIEENTHLCLLGKKFKGFLEKRKKTVVICTQNAKIKENYHSLRVRNNDSFERTSRHIKKAIRHEAVHVAQECNNGKLLNGKEFLKMNPSKLKALKGSIKISGEEDKEKEAYILEDRPKLIKKELIKYCL